MIWNVFANPYYWANKKKALLTFSQVENTKQLIQEKNQPWNIQKD